ncbi:MAG TPA: hypothetical protein VMU09_07575 [Acidimicrobiales bacterium]|nr:hypothetical protein [Acidimicrobiales bacterium]
MIVVDVLLAANLAVLAVLVVADRSRSHRARPAEVLAATRAPSRGAVKSQVSPGPGTPACGGIVIPIDRARRAASTRHPAWGQATLGHPAGGGLGRGHVR